MTLPTDVERLFDKFHFMTDMDSQKISIEKNIFNLMKASYQI